MASNQSYSIVTETAVSLTKNYILNLAVSGTTIAVGLSYDQPMIYKLANDQLKKVCTLPGHEESVTELIFDHDNSNLLFTSSTDGSLKLWDLRNNQQVANIYKGQETLKTPLLAFDIDSTGRILCAGTEHTDGDAFLLFWDIRSTKLLGGYWESHDDDITQVIFHDTKRDLMATGSTDGLINVFDVSLPNESDSLQYTYNTMSSVQKLNWFNTASETLSCITHTNDLQLWDVHSCERLAHIERKRITENAQRIASDDCYLINTHCTKNKELIVLAGSNANDGECLEGLSYNNGKLKTKLSFPSNKQIIRSSWYDELSETFIMGGESSILSIWKSGIEDEREVKNELKIIPKKSHKMKPY